METAQGMISRHRILKALATGDHPTERDVAALVGLSVSTTHRHIDTLVREGYLVRDPRAHRSLVLV
jgi:DNA-binding IclR family transcriptional regulator